MKSAVHVFALVPAQSLDVGIYFRSSAQSVCLRSSQEPVSEEKDEDREMSEFSIVWVMEDGRVFGVSVLQISASYTSYEYTTASSPALISSVNSSPAAVSTSAPVTPATIRFCRLLRHDFDFRFLVLL
jgi:hypothetical protein